MLLKRGKYRAISCKCLSERLSHLFCRINCSKHSTPSLSRQIVLCKNEGLDNLLNQLHTSELPKAYQVYILVESFASFQTVSAGYGTRRKPLALEKGLDTGRVNDFPISPLAETHLLVQDFGVLEFSAGARRYLGDGRCEIDIIQWSERLVS